MLLRIAYRIFLLLCTCVPAPSAAQQDLPATERSGFELDSDDDGVEVWVRPETNDDMSVYISTYADGSVAGARTILDDATSYPEWVHRCASARTVAGDRPGNFLFVSRIDMPFPFGDKTVVARVDQYVDHEGRLIRKIVAHPEALPNPDGEERLQVYLGSWIVTPAANGRVRLTCTVRTDAGSGLPNWLRKEIMTGGPIKTMKNLRVRLAERPG